MIIYIAGPISNPSAWVREQNILRAEAMLLRVLDAGLAGICVHSSARVMYGERDEDVFLNADFELIEHCDAVQLVEGWERSRGTAKEIAHAHRVAVPVFRDLDDLVRWRAAVTETDLLCPDRRQLRRLAVDYGALVPGSDEP